MSEGPTIGDWTQYEWIPGDASSFPARVRLRNTAWMVYYEPDVVVQRMQAENAKLREQLEYALQTSRARLETIDRLKAENEKLRAARDTWQENDAKLRELANGYEALTATLCNERECDGCPFNGTDQIVCEHMRLQTCLSELGVDE